MIFPIFLGALVGVLQYFSEHLHFKKFRSQLVSLGAGVAVTYIILQLLPEFDKWIRDSPAMYIAVLAGFTLFHIAEKTIYTHSKGDHRKRELSEFHCGIVFLYYIITGISITSFAKEGYSAAILFTVPVLLHTFTSNLTHYNGHIWVPKNKTTQIVLASSAVLGTILGVFFPFTRVARAAFVGFIAGALLYLVIKEELPSYSYGDSNYFVIGILIYFLLIASSWLF